MGETTDVLICKYEEDQRECLRSQSKSQLVDTIMTLYEQLDTAESRVRALELENAVLREEFERAKTS